MIKMCNTIAASLLDCVYSNMDFLEAYSSFAEEPILVSLPSFSNTSLGAHQLIQALKSTLIDLLKEKVRKQPEIKGCEKLWSSRVKTFNSLIL